MPSLYITHSSEPCDFALTCGSTVLYAHSHIAKRYVFTTQRFEPAYEDVFVHACVFLYGQVPPEDLGVYQVLLVMRFLYDHVEHAAPYINFAKLCDVYARDMTLEAAGLAVAYTVHRDDAEYCWLWTEFGWPLALWSALFVVNNLDTRGCAERELVLANAMAVAAQNLVYLVCSRSERPGRQQAVTEFEKMRLGSLLALMEHGHLVLPDEIAAFELVQMWWVARPQRELFRELPTLVRPGDVDDSLMRHLAPKLPWLWELCPKQLVRRFGVCNDDGVVGPNGVGPNGVGPNGVNTDTADDEPCILMRRCVGRMHMPSDKAHPSNLMWLAYLNGDCCVTNNLDCPLLCGGLMWTLRIAADGRRLEVFASLPPALAAAAGPNFSVALDLSIKLDVSSCQFHRRQDDDACPELGHGHVHEADGEDGARNEASEVVQSGKVRANVSATRGDAAPLISQELRFAMTDRRVFDYTRIYIEVDYYV